MMRRAATRHAAWLVVMCSLIMAPPPLFPVPCSPSPSQGEHAAFFLILRSIVAEKARERMDDALTIFEKSSWMRCSMLRACALECRVSVLLSCLIVRSALSEEARVRVDDALSIVRL
jgi:hypothetical protein